MDNIARGCIGKSGQAEIVVVEFGSGGTGEMGHDEARYINDYVSETPGLSEEALASVTRRCGRPTFAQNWVLSTSSIRQAAPSRAPSGPWRAATPGDPPPSLRRKLQGALEPRDERFGRATVDDDGAALSQFFNLSDGWWRRTPREGRLATHLKEATR
jgi:hypothetical protein